MRAFPCLASLSRTAITALLAASLSAAALRPALGSAIREAHNCKCIAGDRLYAQGEVACIRGQPMRCGMSLNNSSWLVLNGKCPENRLSILPHIRRLPLPVTPL